MNILKEKLPIFGILLLALYMRLHFMGRSLYYDELYTAIHGVQAPTLLEALYKNFSTTNHLGYTAIAYLTCHILGLKEWTLRLPALLFGLGSIFLFWNWTRKYFGNACAILGSLFLALAPAHIIWSASGRGYSACVFFTILSTSLYFSLLEKPSLKSTLMLSLSNTLALTFHLYFFCIFLAQFFHFLIINLRFYISREPFIKRNLLFNILLSMALTILCTFLIYFPVLSILNGMASDHRAFVPDFPLTLLRDLLSLPLWPVGMLCISLMLIGFIYSNSRLIHWRTYIVLIFFMIIPIWLKKPVYLYPRFFAFLLPYFFLLLSSGIVNIVRNSPKLFKPFVTLLISGLIGFVIWSWCTKPSKIVEDFHYKFRESVRFAESVATNDTKFCAFGNEDDFFQFYSDRPVVTFKTFEDFQKFYDSENQIICFTMNGLPMPEEHKKIFLYTLLKLNPKEKDFDNIIVFDLKG